MVSRVPDCVPALVSSAGFAKVPTFVAYLMPVMKSWSIALVRISERDTSRNVAIAGAQ